MTKFGMPVVAMTLAVSFASFAQTATASNEAIRSYVERASSGEADAQVRLGAIYAKGQGVSPSEGIALKWYRRAAEQGHVGGQLQLSEFLASTKTIQPDRVEAYKWALIARRTAETARERGRAAELADQMGSQLSPEQVQAAKSAASEWEPRKPVAKAAMPDDEGPQRAPDVDQDHHQPERAAAPPARERSDGDKRRRSAAGTLEYALERARLHGFNVPENWERRARSRFGF